MNNMIQIEIVNIDRSWTSDVPLHIGFVDKWFNIASNELERGINEYEIDPMFVEANRVVLIDWRRRRVRAWDLKHSIGKSDCSVLNLDFDSSEEVQFPDKWIGLSEQTCELHSDGDNE